MQYLDATKNPYVKGSFLRTTLPYSNEIVFPANPHERKDTLKLEKTIDRMAQTFLIVDYEIEPILTDKRQILAPDLGLKTFENIMLQTVVGKVELMQLKPAFNIWQFNRLKGKPIYDYISKGLEIPDDFIVVGKCTLKIPIFAFYAERIDAFLPVRNLEDLQINLETASVNEMGVGVYNVTDSANPIFMNLVPLKSLKISVVQESFNKSNTNVSMFENGTKIAITDSIKHSYNVFYEETSILKAGTTSHNLLLRCEYPLPVLVGMIYNNKYSKKINSYSIKVRNTYIVKDISIDSEYSLYDKDVPRHESMYLERWFNTVHEVLSNTGLTTWSEKDQMSPAYLEINYDPIVEDYNLYVFSPYISYQSVSPEGRIGINESDNN